MLLWIFGCNREMRFENDPRSFDFQFSTTFGRGLKVVHTIFGHDFWPKMAFTFFARARRHMYSGSKKIYVSWLEDISVLARRQCSGRLRWSGGVVVEWSWNGRRSIFTFLTKVIDEWFCRHMGPPIHGSAAGAAASAVLGVCARCTQEDMNSESSPWCMRWP